ncbi:hypothetical protein Hypma_015387 [Hypsizygus marmoreus]|uniref:Uncharacterized protein n=1 Tax=Hypsizygus marmoreus TaxID=39966 RepID=A0A369K4Q6_HYPMA|nr:hypothetical protein Hypma_015387 [Hypsizygus marmoreus]
MSIQTTMADLSSSLPYQQTRHEGQGRGQRQRPKATLMDCILRTPLKSLRRSSHLSLTIVPVTPPEKHEKKRKFHSSSSTSNENITPGNKASTSTTNPRSSSNRRLHSDPAFVNHSRSRTLFPNSEQHEQYEVSPEGPAKRSRVDDSSYLHVNPVPPFHQDESMIYGMSEEDVEYELHRLQLYELAACPSIDANGHTIQAGNTRIPPDLHRLLRNMKTSLDIERRARRNAEESHLIELRKRLEMEKLVEELQERETF